MGRELTFSDPKIIRLVSDKFVAVTGDDWYQRRRDDAEGKFFRSVADQGPRKGKGGDTRQGIYIFTASGKLLDFHNHHDPNIMRQAMQQGLAAWNRLPAGERKPGAVKVQSGGKVDSQFDRSAPQGTLIVNVYSRILERNDDGTYKPGTSEFTGGDRPGRDHLWLLEAEWKALIPKNAHKGQKIDMPRKLLQRIVRFHLVDNTRGEPPMWKRQEIRFAKMTLTVEKADEKAVSLRVDGNGLLATSANAKKAKRGFDFNLLGYIHYNAQKKQIDRFDLVAIGDHWGQGAYNRKARPGRQPFGIAFRLSSGESAADRVPPQAARWMDGYIHADRY